jgi:hypothetical protein
MKSIFITFAIVLSSLLLNAQEFIKSDTNKAIIYFVRTSSIGSAINFRYFDGEQYIGKFKGKGYFYYECDPGNYLFWASSENADFIEAELQEGKTYVIIADPKMGGLKARVALSIMNFSDDKSVKKILKIIDKKSSSYISSSEITKGQEKYANHISKSLTEYQSLIDNNIEIPTIIEGMEVPEKYISKANNTSKYLKN